MCIKKKLESQRIIKDFTVLARDAIFRINVLALVPINYKPKEHMFRDLFKKRKNTRIN